MHLQVVRTSDVRPAPSVPSVPTTSTSRTSVARRGPVRARHASKTNRKKTRRRVSYSSVLSDPSTRRLRVVSHARTARTFVFAHVIRHTSVSSTRIGSKSLFCPLSNPDVLRFKPGSIRVRTRNSKGRRPDRSAAGDLPSRAPDGSRSRGAGSRAPPSESRSWVGGIDGRGPSAAELDVAMAHADVRAAVLICIDGWGLREEEYGNAVKVRVDGTKGRGRDGSGGKDG